MQLRDPRSSQQMKLVPALEVCTFCSRYGAVLSPTHLAMALGHVGSGEMVIPDRQDITWCLAGGFMLHACK